MAAVTCALLGEKVRVLPIEATHRDRIGERFLSFLKKLKMNNHFSSSSAAPEARLLTSITDSDSEVEDHETLSP